jgi:predicted dehydrogenase
MNKLRALLSTSTESSSNEHTYQPRPAHTLPSSTPKFSAHPPRLILIGGGSRGSSLARAIVHGSNGHLVAVAEPDPFKRRQLGRHCIWGLEDPKEGEEFETWREFLEWETARRENGTAGNKKIDAAIICTPDRTHREIVTGLAPLQLHIMCEKPLATALGDCVSMYQQLRLNQGPPSVLFAVGHVMRYTPHNQLLRKLVREDHTIGDIVSIEHTENVGWWHFAHSYVR